MEIKNPTVYEGKEAIECELIILTNHYQEPEPILISRTEKIQIGDYAYDTKAPMVVIVGENNQSILTFNLDGFFKVIALPYNFTPVQIEQIENGKLKAGDKVYVECQPKYIEPDGDIHCNRGGFFNEIKYTTITSYPPSGTVEKKYINIVSKRTFTKEEVEELTKKALIDGYECGYAKSEWHTLLTTWFKENVV